MENLEKQCLDRLNKILSKCDLEINIVVVSSIECQYRLNIKSVSKNGYHNWICLWLSVPDIFINNKYNRSIFKRLYTYYNIFTEHYTKNKPILNYESDSHLYTVQQCAKAYKDIQCLENISCLEEFIIKCDLMGI